MVDDVDNQVAEDRLSQDFNVKGYPTSFFDGGYKVKVGSGISESSYRTTIRSCGLRDVHELDLSLSVEWIDDGVLEIEVIVTNNEEMPNISPNTPMITGPTDGKVRIEYKYTIVATDPNEDDVYYDIDWGDDTTSGWIGPYPSGEEVTISHAWSEQETYTIKVKAKDDFDAESDWATLEISMPKTKPYLNRPFLNILENFIERFPLLARLLNQRI